MSGSVGGGVIVHRSLLDDPDFPRATKAEPYCKRMAWIWLTMAARWSEGVERGPHGPIHLQRGQLSYSNRFLAVAWGWDEPKVRRFLDKMKACGKIDCVTDAGQNKITVRNYEQSQSFNTQSFPEARVTDAAIDAGPTQARRGDDANQNQGNQDSNSAPSERSGDAAPDAGSEGDAERVVSLAEKNIERRKELREDCVALLREVEPALTDKEAYPAVNALGKAHGGGIAGGSKALRELTRLPGLLKLGELPEVEAAKPGSAARRRALVGFVYGMAQTVAGTSTAAQARDADRRRAAPVSAATRAMEAMQRVAANGGA